MTQVDCRQAVFLARSRNARNGENLLGWLESLRRAEAHRLELGQCSLGFCAVFFTLHGQILHWDSANRLCVGRN